MTTSAEHTADLLRPVLADLARVVGAITEDQLHDPTPCTEFDVEQLRNHVLGWLTNFAAGYADPHGQARADVEGYRAPADPAAEVRSAACLLDQAIRDGAAVRPLKPGEAGMPGDMALGMILWSTRCTAGTWQASRGAIRSDGRAGADAGRMACPGRARSRAPAQRQGTRGARARGSGCRRAG